MRAPKPIQSYQSRKFHNIEKGLAGIPPDFPDKYNTIIEMEAKVVDGLEGARRSLDGDVTGLTDVVDALALRWTKLRSEFLMLTVNLAAMSFADDNLIRQALMIFKRSAGQGVNLKVTDCEGNA